MENTIAMVPISQYIFDILRDVRYNSEKVLRKEKRLHRIHTRIEDDRAKIAILSDGYDELKAKDERRKVRTMIEEMSTHLDDVKELRDRLSAEISHHKVKLSYAQERVGEELCRLMVAGGQLELKESLSDMDSDVMEGVASEQDHSRAEGQGWHAEEVDQTEDHPCQSNGDGTSEDGRRMKAMSLINAAREGVMYTSSNLRQFERMQEEQRHAFKMGEVPEWRDMTRTEFDLGLLGEKLQLTRELIEAQEAYSVAGRFAKEVGYVREDSDQSWHFLDVKDDGLCSGEREETFVEMDTRFVEQWRQKVGPSTSSCPSMSDKDSEDEDDSKWEVFSVGFGEGCSAHADEWSKVRIDRMEGLRLTEEEKLRSIGIFTSADAIIYPSSPLPGLQELGSGGAPLLGQPGLGVARAGLLKPPFAVVRDWLSSGQAAFTKVQAVWLSRRGSDSVLR